MSSNEAWPPVVQLQINDHVFWLEASVGLVQEQFEGLEISVV